VSDEIAEVFRTFDAQLRPTAEDRERLAAERAAVVTALTRGGAPVLRVIDAGAWAHDTAVRGVSALDLVVVLEGTRPRSAARARDLLGAAGSVAAEGAPGSVGVRLIPAFEVPGPSAESDLVVIPESGGRWVRHRPGARGVLMSRIDDDGALRMLVRFLVAWKHRSAPVVSSYYLETVAIRQALQQRSFSLLWDLCWVWESLAADGLVPVADPSSPGGSRSIRPAASMARAIESQFALERAASSARGAVNAYVDGDLDRAGSYLQALFGEEFPELSGGPEHLL